MQIDQSTIQKLVSLTFDENPKVRKDAARKLAEVEDPAAVFALMELSYDKELDVRKVAQEILDKKKSAEQEVMSFTEIFSIQKPQPTESQKETLEEKKAKILHPITMLFEKRLGKERAAVVKKRMMPAIEKVYMKSHITTGEIGHDNQYSQDNSRRTIQEFLTSYLDAIASIDGGSEDLHVESDLPEEVKHREIVLENPLDLSELSIKKKDPNLISREVKEIELREKEEYVEQKTWEHLPETMFKKAYEAMLLSGGDDKVMRREMFRMIRDLQKDVKLAFILAKKRFKETKITHLTSLKDGIRNVNTDPLTIKSVENTQYKKGKILKTLTRLIAQDEEGNEGVVYLFDSRGSWVKEGMHIKIVKGYVKSFDFSGETALAISKKGNVYIVL